MEQYSIPYIQHLLPLVSLIGLDPNIDPRQTINPEYASQKKEVTLKILETWGVNEGSALWHLSAIPNTTTNLTNNSPILANSKEVFFNKDGVSIKKGTLNLFKVITQPKVMLPTKRTGLSGVGNPSSLSPNNQASPLFPDGIITPLWCKKHQLESPAVIIMFFDLWKFDAGASNSEENKLHHILNQNSVQNTVREKDSALAQTISDYRKLMNERGIKLIAVFWNLNNQDDLVEDRLLHIRRTSGLDPKTGFFILDDEASKRLPEFIHGIQKSMAESCMNYYRERYKIVKKKYTRLNHLPAPLPDNALSLLGWAARYEFKLGTFAAFRQDFELAVKHYESCYFSLIEMLIKLELNLNRRERWKETLDFMDCLSLNINRLMLYLESPQLSLIQLKRHLFYGKSLRLSKTSGLGLPEHEYSKWEFSQYFAFAELLDCGIKFGVKYSPANLSASSQSQHKSIAMTSNLLLHGSPVKNRMGDTKITQHSGSTFQFSSEAANISPNSSAVFQYDDVNPISIVQHPGYYYYQAAECLINQTHQKKSFVEEGNNQSIEPKEQDAGESEDPQSKETAQIIEVLSKSYEQFKKYRGHRMTLLVASKIAETYLNSEKYDLASKFYERIAKSYRKESWPQLLQMILLNGLKCAQYLENSSEWFLLNSFELLSPNFTLIEGQHQSIVKGIQDKFNEPSTSASAELSNPIPKNVIIEIESPKTSFIYFSATFEPNPIDTHLGVKLQLQVQVHSSSTNEPFNLSFIKVSFKDSSLDFQFQHDDSASVDVKESNINGDDVKYIKHSLEDQNSNQISKEENVLRLIPSNLELNWKGCTKVLETTILPYDAEFLEITSIHGSISNPNYQIIFKQKLPDNQLSSFIKPIGLNDQIQNPQLDTPSYPSTLQQLDFNSCKWLSYIEEDNKLKWIKLREIEATHSIKIQKPTSLLKIEFEPPTQSYLDESNNIKIQVKNEHTDPINIELYISIVNSNSDDKLLEIEGGEIISKDLIKFNIEQLAQNESIEQEFRYIFRKFEGERQLTATVIYHKINAKSSTIKYQVEKTYTFNTINPFKAQFQFLPRFGILNDEEYEINDNSVDSIIEAIAPNLSVAKECLMLINLNGPDNTEVEIESIKWAEENVYNDEDKYKWKLIESSLESTKQVLKPHSSLSIQNLIRLKLLNYSLGLKNQADANSNFKGWRIDWKSMTVVWKRLNSRENELNHTEISIPSLLIHDHKIEVNIDLPNEAYQSEPFSIRYEVQNHTEFTQELVASFDFNDIPLVFLGYKVQTLMLLPYSNANINIICHPLTYGRILLPRLVLEEAKTNNQGNGAHSDLNIDRDISWGWDYKTTYLMVLPDHAV